MKQLFLLAGLPRSGSTLLGTILNQNPNLYIPHTSSFVEILWRNYSVWNDKRFAEDFMGNKMQQIKIPFLKKLFQSYFSELTNKPIVIDKRRSWQSIDNIKMYKEIFGISPKIICCVRNIEEIVASYKTLHLKNNKLWNEDALKDNRFQNALKDLQKTYNSKFKDCLLFIEYNSLVKQTQKTLNKIYDFINQPSYLHDLNNIISIDPHKEVEKLYGLKGMFNVSKSIKKSNTNTNILTNEEYNDYSSKTFWKEFTKDINIKESYQLDDIYHNGICDWKDAIKVTKDKYPK